MCETCKSEIKYFDYVFLNKCKKCKNNLISKTGFDFLFFIVFSVTFVYFSEYIRLQNTNIYVRLFLGILVGVSCSILIRSIRYARSNKK